MFLRHNVSQLHEPANVAFEPSPIWHDDEAIVTDESAKVFLRNLLSKSKGQVRELRVEADRKKGEVNGARRIRENIRQGKDNRSEVEVVRFIFSQQESLHEVERRRLAAEVETSTIIAVVGDLSLGAQNHNFKAQTFKIPTNCDLCGERIWGLSAKGFDCRDCGYTCHSKCEMKVPAECPGEQSKEDKKKLKVVRQEQANATPTADLEPSNGSTHAPSLTRQDTMNSLSSGYAASATRSMSNATSHPSAATPAELPTPNAPAPTAPLETKPVAAKRSRVLAPPPTQYISAPASELSPTPSAPAKEPKGKMLYAYQAGGADEVTVDEGNDVAILEPDGGLFRAPCHIPTSANLCRWIRVDASSCRGKRRPCPRVLCRSRICTIPSAACQPGPSRPTGLDVLELVGVTGGQRSRETSWAGGCAAAGREETAICRSIV